MKTAYLGPTRKPLPHAPNRDTILSLKCAFQGLTVNTIQFGQLPWWETIAWLDWYEDRKRAYDAKRINGDTHAIVDISGWYNEPGQPYNNPAFAHDYTNNLYLFRERVIEVINNGYWPLIMLAGDGQSVNDNPAYKQYNDTNGWTYGHQWLMQNFTRIHSYLSDLDKYIIYCPGYDGVFYGWSPEQVVAFGQLFRSVSPSGYLALEFNTGHIPVGEGGADYKPGGRMQDYDLILGEFFGWIGEYKLSDYGNPKFINGRPNYKGNQIWQIVARMVSPYHWPSDEPNDADSHPPPFYLPFNNPRGPFYFCAFEYDVYRWVRSRVSAVAIQEEREYFKKLGCKLVC